MCGVNGDEIYLPYNLSFYILYIYMYPYGLKYLWTL